MTPMNNSPARLRSLHELSSLLQHYWSEPRRIEGSDPLGVRRYANDRAQALATPFAISSLRS
jgi:hypothetical protein